MSSRNYSCSTHPYLPQSRGQICTSFQRLRRRLLEDYEAGDRGKVSSPTRHIRRRRAVAAGGIAVGHGRRDWPRGGAAMKIDVWWLLLLEGRVGAVPYATAVPPCQPAPAWDKDGVCYARAFLRCAALHNGRDLVYFLAHHQPWSCAQERSWRRWRWI